MYMYILFGGEFSFFYLTFVIEQSLAKMCEILACDLSLSLSPSTAGEDFNSFDVRTTLQPGLSSWHFNLDIINDGVAEPTKHFGISLSLLTIIPNARLSNAQLNVTIIDDNNSKKGRERERERDGHNRLTDREKDRERWIDSIINVLAVFVCGQELVALVVILSCHHKKNTFRSSNVLYSYTHTRYRS